MFSNAGLDLISVGTTLLLVSAQVLVTLYASRDYTTVASVVNDTAAPVVLNKGVFFRARAVVGIRTLKNAVDTG